MKRIRPSKGNEPTKIHQIQHNNDKCCYCKKLRHIKVECSKRNVWFEKRVSFLPLYVSNQMLQIFLLTPGG